MSGTRYAAFLRGITPMNAKMPELKRAFEAAGFDDVSTVISSGNVVFGTGKTAVAALQRQCERAMQEQLGRSFLTIIRAIADLEAILEADPFRQFRLDTGAKRVVTFLREPPEAKLKLPIERDGARILLATDTEVYAAYVASPKGGVFMKVIEDAYGEAVTTRTWGTVANVVKRGLAAAPLGRSP